MSNSTENNKVDMDTKTVSKHIGVMLKLKSGHTSFEEISRKSSSLVKAKVQTGRQNTISVSSEEIVKL